MSPVPYFTRDRILSSVSATTCAFCMLEAIVYPVQVILRIVAFECGIWLRGNYTLPVTEFFVGSCGIYSLGRVYKTCRSLVKVLVWHEMPQPYSSGSL